MELKLSFRSIPMSQLALICLIFLSLTIVSPPEVAAADGGATQKLSAYDVLKSYNFPIGLLPKGVTGYKLDHKTGKFAAYLNGTCSFSIQGYQLKYRSTITGTITKGKLKDLKGVSVKILLFWINIIEVTRTDDELEFSVGIASANFPIDGFDECPQCGCGFNCVNQQVRSIRTNPFALPSSKS